jgi:hypothetical protein
MYLCFLPNRIETFLRRTSLPHQDLDSKPKGGNQASSKQGVEHEEQGVEARG